jgi:thioredoxin 1
MSIQVTDANFNSTILSSDKLSMIEFGAAWCGPCRAMEPVMKELATAYAGKVNIGLVDLDTNPQLSVNYGVTSVPAILWFKDGKLIDRQLGAAAKHQLDRKIQAHLQ